MRTLHGPADLEEAKGTTLGTSDWVVIDQARIQTFAEATGDFQWIHVDLDRAAKGPYGAPIAHGYLTLSLLPMFGAQVYSFAGWSAAINYGLDRVRFLSPVTVGSRLRAHVELTDVVTTPAGVRVHLRSTVELDGSSRPACIADAIVLLV